MPTPFNPKLSHALDALIARHDAGERGAWLRLKRWALEARIPRDQLVYPKAPARPASKCCEAPR